MTVPKALFSAIQDSPPAFTQPSTGTLKGSIREYKVAIIDAFIDRIGKIFDYVLSRLFPSYYKDDDRPTEPLIKSYEGAKWISAKVVDPQTKLDNILSSISNIVAYLKKKNIKINEQADLSSVSNEEKVINEAKKLLSFKIDDANMGNVNLTGLSQWLNQLKIQMQLTLTKGAMDQIRPLITNVIAEIDSLNKGKVESSFSKLIGFMQGEIKYNRKPDKFDQISFPHSGTGTISGIPFWNKYVFLNGCTLSIPKNPVARISYENGEIEPNGAGIIATSSLLGNYHLVRIKVQKEGRFSFDYVTPEKNKEFGDVVIKQETVSEDNLAYIFSKVTWEPLALGESDSVDEEIPAEEVEINPPLSLFNKVALFADENSQVIIGTVSTVAMVGAYYLGLI